MKELFNSFAGDNDSMLVKVPIGRVENGSLKLYEGARPIFPGL